MLHMATSKTRTLTNDHWPCPVRLDLRRIYHRLRRPEGWPWWIEAQVLSLALSHRSGRDNENYDDDDDDDLVNGFQRCKSIFDKYICSQWSLGRYQPQWHGWAMLSILIPTIRNLLQEISTYMSRRNQSWFFLGWSLPGSCINLHHRSWQALGCKVGNCFDQWWHYHKEGS